MPRKKVDFEFPKAAILWRLHKAVADNEKVVFKPDAISNELGLNVQLVSLAVEELEEAELCVTTTEEEWGEHPFTGQEIQEDVTFVEITRSGIRKVESWDDDFHDDVIKRIFESRPRPQWANLLSESSGSSENSEVPASNRIVTTKDNVEAHRKAVNAVEEFAKEAAGSNEFKALFDDPDDAQVILDEINMGLVLLKKAKVRLQALKELIVTNLKLVADKMSEATLGALASKALDALLKFMGIG